jgi:HSP20 family protein
MNMSLLNALIPTLSRTPARREVSSNSSTPGIRPAYELRENADAWGLTVYVPGVDKSGLSITDEDGTLVIRGERNFKQPGGWTSLYRESSDLPFELLLRHDNGFDIDKVHAELKDGVLRVSLPKVEARKPRKINVA